MRKKWLKNTGILLLVVLFIMILLNVPVYKIYNYNESDVIFKEFVNQNREKTVCLLDYTYTTGAGWLVLNSTRKDMIGQDIVLSSFFNPRLLKDNKEFDMDYLANYIVVFDKAKKTMIEDETVSIIYPDEIGIVFDTNKEIYRIKDFSFLGLVKGLFGVFFPNFKLSI